MKSQQFWLWFAWFWLVLVEDLPGKTLPIVTGSMPSIATSGTVPVGATSISLTFCEPVLGGEAASNYELRHAGVDGILGNGDDALIALTPKNSGTTANLACGALAEGVYRLTVKDTITDNVGNPLDGDADGSAGGNWVRDFIVAGVGLVTTSNLLSPVSLDGYSATTADFNQDGWLDVAFAAFGSAIVFVNNQAGGFTGPTMVAEAADHDIAAADFNGDGWVDLVGSIYGRGVCVTLNDGSGGFEKQFFIPNAVSWYSLVTGDFNEDGKADFAVAGHPNQVTVYFGNGLGEFPTSLALTTAAPGSSSAIHHIATGDVNNDGSADLVTAAMANREASVFLGNGVGAFSGPFTFRSASTDESNSGGAQTVAIGDVNGDNTPDLVIADPWFGNGVVRVLLGDGSGRTFAPRGSYATGAVRPYSVAIVDYDGDNKVDLLVANRDGGTFSFLRGDGTGEFPTATNLAAVPNGHEVTVADFNRDGRPEAIVVGYSSGTNRLQIQSSTTNPAALVLTGVGGTSIDIDTMSFGAGQLVQGGPSHPFDGLNRLQVGGADYCPTGFATSTDGGRTVRTFPQVLAGLTVLREITVPNAGSQGFARTVDVFTNPTSDPITVPLRIVGNLGADAATQVFKTLNADGTFDAVVAPTDRWVGTDDVDGGGTPAIIHYLHGPLGLLPSIVQLVGDNIFWEYTLTVPAGDTVRLAQFTILNTTRSGAEADANVLVSSGGFGGKAAEFLTAPKLGALKNFQFGSLSPALDGSGNLTITDGDGAGKNNRLTIQNDGAGNLVITDAVDAFRDTGGIAGAVLSNGERTLTVPIASIVGSRVVINGGAANDALTVNLSRTLEKELDFNGGLGGDDSLSITGYTLTTSDGVADVRVTHARSGSGTVVLADLQTLAFDEIELLTVAGTAADLAIVLPKGADQVTLGDDGGEQDTHGNTGNTSALCDRSIPGSIAFTEFTNPTNSLWIQRGSAADDLHVLDLAASGFTASLMIGDTGSEFDQVTFSGPVTLDANKNLVVHASGEISLPTAASRLATRGDGTISLTTARNIRLIEGASATTVDGDLTLNANATGATEGVFLGLYLNGSTVASTGNGAIRAFGRGGTGGGKGVRLQHGGRIIGGSNSVTVTGLGGAVGIEAVGVFLDDPTSEINSTGGSVQVVGTGGGANYHDAAGVEVAGAKIGVGGTGSLTIHGTGGLGTDNQHGVRVRGVDSQITSRGGDIRITGIAGAGTSSGILIETGGQVLATTGAPTVTISADSMRLESETSIQAGTNLVILKNQTPGTRIDVGGADVLTGSPLTLGLTDTELDRVTARSLQIGSATSGPINLTADIHRSLATNVTLVSGDDIVLSGRELNTLGGTLLLESGAFQEAPRRK